MNNDTSPLISIIVAVFNGKATLQQCIDSVSQQTYQNKELIIIDGGSKDGTVNLLEENCNKFSYWVSESDRGIYNAWNKGLKQARGDWICFLGADDFFWDATVLERMVVQLVQLPTNIRVAYGQIMMIHGDGQLPTPVGKPWEQIKETFEFMSFMNMPHVGTMHRGSLFEQHGLFDESFSIAGDYEFMLRELKIADAAFIPNLITVGQRLGGISTNPTNLLKKRREVWRAQKIHGQLLPSFIFLKQFKRQFLNLIKLKVLGNRWVRWLVDFRRIIKGLPPYWTKK